MKRLFLTLAVLLSSYVPAGAQTRSAQLSLIQQRPAPITLVAAAPSHLPRTAFSPAQPLAERPAGFTALLVAVHDRNTLERLFPMEVVRTPFVRQVRMEVARFWGGRLQLDGFESTRYMENVQLGLSGSGFRNPRGGAFVPRADSVYGITLRFRLGREGQTKARAEGWSCLARLVSPGRSSRP